MPQDEPSGPDLAGVIADANSAGLEHVVIGGFSVIFHGYVRATRDSDLLVPDGKDADETILRFLELADARRLSDGKKLAIDDIASTEHLRVNSRRGIIDIIRGGSPPFDFDTVSNRADTTEWEGQVVRVAALPSVVGFKRLARRPQDRVDLEELEAIHGATCRWSRFPASIHSRSIGRRAVLAAQINWLSFPRAIPRRLASRLDRRRGSGTAPA